MGPLSLFTLWCEVLLDMCICQEYNQQGQLVSSEARPLKTLTVAQRATNNILTVRLNSSCLREL